MHIVHKDPNGDQHAVIGVFFDMEAGGSEENAWLKSVSDGIASKDSSAPTDIDIVQLMDSLDFDKNYSYMGSFTTPPCTEDIEWILLQTVETISPAQLAIFTSKLAEDNAFAGGNGNNRAIQPVNDRVICHFH